MKLEENNTHKKRMAEQHGFLRVNVKDVARKPTVIHTLHEFLE